MVIMLNYIVTSSAITNPVNNIPVSDIFMPFHHSLFVKILAVSKQSYICITYKWIC